MLPADPCMHCARFSRQPIGALLLWPARPLSHTQVAIEQLQSELSSSRKEEAVLREEAQQVRACPRSLAARTQATCGSSSILLSTRQPAAGASSSDVAHPACAADPWAPCTTTNPCLNPAAAASLQICDEQAAELRRAEEQLAAVQSALAARSTQVSAGVGRAGLSCSLRTCTRNPRRKLVSRL